MNAQLAFETLARILAQAADAEVTVKIKSAAIGLVHQ